MERKIIITFCVRDLQLMKICPSDVQWCDYQKHDVSFSCMTFKCLWPPNVWPLKTCDLYLYDLLIHVWPSMTFKCMTFNIQPMYVWPSNVYWFPNRREDSRVTITLNKETTVFNLQNMFRHSYVIFSYKWALTVVHLNFCIKVRYKITL